MNDLIPSQRRTWEEHEQQLVGPDVIRREKITQISSKMDPLTSVRIQNVAFFLQIPQRFGGEQSQISGVGGTLANHTESRFPDGGGDGVYFGLLVVFNPAVGIGAAQELEKPFFFFSCSVITAS